MRKFNFRTSRHFSEDIVDRMMVVDMDHRLPDPVSLPAMVRECESVNAKVGGEGRMSRTKSAFKYLLAFFMVVAGASHFVNPQFYMGIMPPYRRKKAAVRPSSR